ncbi:MAG: class I adenylate-forming enzyme family protein [Microbacteriaceae bacterium]
MTDLLEAVLGSADAHPEAAALTFRRRTLTYGELARRIRSVSSALGAHGLADGDRVLFSVRPGPDAVVLALGIVHARGTVVFADPGAGEALFRARAALAAPRWVAAESLLYLASSGPLRPLARRRGLELAPYSRLVPEARHIHAGSWLPGVPVGSVSLRSLQRDAGRASVDAPAPVGATTPGATTLGDPDQEALIIFTSGTTQAPKAVVHTRSSLGAGFGDFAAALALESGQRVLTDQLMIGVPALIAGAHWTMPDPGLDPGARPGQYLEHLPETDVLFASPAALDAFLRALDAEPHRTPRLATLALGGAPVLPPLLSRARARFPAARIRSVYGMTEILPVAIADGDDKLGYSAAGGEGDLVGQVMSSVRVRIDDGELVLSGEGLAKGYLTDLPHAPLAEVRTGDLARLDGERLVLLGRRKDMLIRGTQNVYPGLYEPLIAQLPGVVDAVMVGVPDGIGDDRIVVAVVPAKGAPEAPTRDHPVAASVARALPGLSDAGVLPDAVVAIAGLPRSGRAQKPDRAALVTLLSEMVA